MRATYEHDMPKHLFGEWCYLFGPHLLTTTYHRDWRHLRPWHKIHTIRCFECNIELSDG